MIWLLLAPIAASVLIFAITLRPSRAASCDAAYPCEIDEVPIALDADP